MDQDKLIKAKNLVKSQKDAIIKKYNINNFGVGFKTENGKITEEIAIILHVNKNDKKSMAKIKDLPEDIEGIPTDVVFMEENFKMR